MKFSQAFILLLGLSFCGLLPSTASAEMSRADKVKMNKCLKKGGYYVRASGRCKKMKNRSYPSSSSQRAEAVAFCYEKKNGKWICNGPLQKTMMGGRIFDKEAKTSGCGNYRKRKRWNGDGKYGWLIFCGRNLTSTSRDLRSQYGVN